MRSDMALCVDTYTQGACARYIFYSCVLFITCKLYVLLVMKSKGQVTGLSAVLRSLHCTQMYSVAYSTGARTLCVSATERRISWWVGAASEAL